MAPLSTRGYYETYWSDEGFNPAPGVHPTYDRLVAPHLGGRCLDFGCGDGRSMSKWLASRVDSYLGVDISESAVESVKTMGLDAMRVEGELPFPDASFDTAVSFDVFEHLFEPYAASLEIIRVLKPGGKLLASVPNAAYWRRRVDLMVGRWNPLGDDQSVDAPWRDPHIRFFTVSVLRRMLKRAGFDRAVVSGYDGTIFRDTPGLRRFGDRPSLLYRRCELIAPSVLGRSLVALATKPR